MKATIVFFSQTGNTRKIAGAIAEELERAGYTTACIPLEEARPEQLTGSDLIGLGTPTFESHAPRPIKDFVESLTALSGQPAFVFATCGGAAGNVLSDVTKLLRRKGAKVIDGFLALGEVHHPAPCIRGKSPHRPDEEDLNDAKRFAQSICQRMRSDPEARYDGPKPRKGFYAVVGKIASSEALIRLLEPRPRLEPRNCRRCQRCARECPTGNIQMSPTPVHGGNCIRCYRCLNVCGHDSYSADWWFGNMVVFALWNRCFMRWFGEYETLRRPWQPGP